MHDARERDALLEVLDSGNWWYGERVRKFEQEFAAFQGVKHCISCTNGTVALEIALQALGIGHGDEVIVPPFTFIATATAALRIGAAPVFVDVDDSWNIDPDLIEEAIRPRTRAIVPVHFGGVVADMDLINALAQKHGLFVIEDACHSWGSQWKGNGTGALGRCGVFSFQASKNMTAGEGGAITTNDDALAEVIRSITHSGRLPGKEWYFHYHVGTNARITEFAAAVLSAQLSRMPEHTAARTRNGNYLDERIASIEGLTPQPADPRMTRRARHLYCLRIDPELFGCTREQLIKAADAEGLPLAAGYPHPLYKQPIFATPRNGIDYTACRCPVAEDLCYRSAVWFRHTLLLSARADMDDIVAVLEKVKRHAHKLH